MFPKTIWRYWEQGWDNAPFVVRHCTESVYHYASDYEVVNLDHKNVYDYISLPLIIDETPNFPVQPKSDLIRILLLKKYGGVWIDSTVFLNGKLARFLDQINSDFFCFFRQPNYVAMSSWFLCASENSYIASRLCDSYVEYLSHDFIDRNKIYFKKWRGSPDYFGFHNTLGKQISIDSKFKSEIEKIPFISSYNKIFPSIGYGYNRDISNDILSDIVNDIPCIKLSYSLQEKDFNQESTLGYLIKKMRGEQINHIKHLHTSIELRPCKILNSFIEKPSVLKYTGSTNSEDDLKLCNDAYSNYHVYNFSSMDNNRNAQLLIPYRANRLFLRYQDGDKFLPAREVAYRDEIEGLIKTYNIWISFIFSSKIDKRVKVKEVFNKIYLQFLLDFDGVPAYLHYEIFYSSAGFYVSLDCENTSGILLVQKYFKKISKEYDYELLLTEKVSKVRKHVPITEIEKELNKLIDLTIDNVHALFVPEYTSQQSDTSGQEQKSQFSIKRGIKKIKFWLSSKK